MKFKKHPNKYIHAVKRYVLQIGWSLIESGSSAHAWGFLYCPEKSRLGCKISVWSTPKVPKNHSKLST